MNKAPAIVHFYPQYDNHTEVFLVGNRDGLFALKKAIEKCLSQKAIGNNIKNVELSCQDGEGFSCYIVHLSEDWQSPTWQQLELPYTASWHNTNPNSLEPWELYKKIQNET
jgi:hypothetical protein